MVNLRNLSLTFGMLSLLTVGGGNAFLPTLQHTVVEQRHWLTAIQFREMYSIGQIAPGPNMMMVILIGYYLKGLLGALLVFLSFIVPDCILIFYLHRLWQRFTTSAWRYAVERGLAPIVIGLMFAGVFTLGRVAIIDTLSLAIAVGTIGILFWRRINPIWLILLGGLITVVL